MSMQCAQCALETRRTLAPGSGRIVNSLYARGLCAAARLASTLHSGQAVRYHVLKAGTSIRNISVCLALVAGSYLASGLINCSPVIQPELTTGYRRAVIVAPSPERGESPAERPSVRPEVELAPGPTAVLSL